jgi:hypothetical protein
MIVKDLLGKTDSDLTAMLEHIGNEPLEWTPVILSELTRRSVVRLLESSNKIERSSKRLEKLTCWLIFLTVVLALVALPPTIDVFMKLLGNTK